MRKIALLLLSLFPLLAVAQSGTTTRSPQASPSVERMLAGDYDGLYSQGPMPADMLLDFNRLYAIDLQRAKLRGANVKVNKLENVSYQVNRMMAGGEILYGDPITEMIERIADTLLRDYPELRDSLRFYTVKSTSVNAFSTGQGMIFVNLGLVAKAENEAALAFALGHEIVHYYRDHTWVELDKDHNIKNDTTRGATHDRFLTYHQRSRSMESEADSLCATLFYGKSRYWKGVTDGVFDMLQYSYLPFGETPFDTTLFDSPYYKLPRSYYLEQVKPISARDDYDDSLSTHPNLLKRRIAMRSLLGNSDEGSKYLVTTPEEFEEIQTLARWECMRQDLINGNYTRAFYNSWVEYMQCPDAFEWYPQKVMCQSLYALAKHKLYAESNNSIQSTDRVEGEEQQVVNLFRKVQPNELAMITVRFLWQHGGSDPQIMRIHDDMLNDLFGKADFRRDYFLATLDTAAKSIQQDTTAVNSKYDLIRQKRQNVRNEDSRRYYFADLMQRDEQFVNWFNNNTMSLDEPAAERYGRSVMVMQPTYAVVNGYKHRMKVKESLRKEQQLLEQTHTIVRQLGGNPVDFSTESLIASGDGGRYNDYVRLCEWVRENSSIDDKVSMLQAVDIQPLAQRYQVDYVTIPLVVNVENLYAFDPIVEFAKLLPEVVFPTMPVYFAGLNQLTLSASHTVNVNTGQSATAADVYTVDHNGINRQLAYESLAESFGEKKGGFMGHPFTVEAGLTVAPTFLGRLIWNFDIPVVAVRPTLGLNWQIGSEACLHLQADYNGSRYDIQRVGVCHDVNTFTFALSVRDGASFPVFWDAFYFGLGATYALVDIKEPAHVYDNTFHRGGILLEMGKNRMLTNRLSLSVNARLNVTIAKFWTDYDYEFDSLMEPYMFRSDFRRRVNSQLVLNNILTYSITLGWKP
ncbi:MAG: M48 family metallopeptidase [Bacteroidales bacterium]|nr:M48 family metallopeptidase [Bacteroidales bacterium]